jgi:TRAP-type C4-dicarboxylate transport system permease small subunit
MGNRQSAGKNAIIGLVLLAIGFGRLCFSWQPATQLEALLPGSVSALAFVLAVIFLLVALVQIRHDESTRGAKKAP